VHRIGQQRNRTAEDHCDRLQGSRNTEAEQRDLGGSNAFAAGVAYSIV
jgi:hypothetical protein